MEIKRSEEEVEDLKAFCELAEVKGISKYPGMSYEQGIMAALDWITGEVNIHPLNEL